MRIVKCDDGVETRNDKGELHSFNGNPSVKSDYGFKEWHKMGKWHKLDGPAIIQSTGEKYWFYEGKEIECSSTKEFLKIINLKAFW